MAKRNNFAGMPGGMGNMLKQVQKMQKDMEKAQEEIASKEVEATVGGGVIKVIATGDKKIKEIKINPDAIDPEDVEMLEDLILTAVNSALEKAQELSDSSMSSLTSGLNIPGLF